MTMSVVDPSAPGLWALIVQPRAFSPFNRASGIRAVGIRSAVSPSALASVLGSTPGNSEAGIPRRSAPRSSAPQGVAGASPAEGLRSMKAATKSRIDAPITTFRTAHYGARAQFDIWDKENTPDSIDSFRAAHNI